MNQTTVGRKAVLILFLVNVCNVFVCVCVWGGSIQILSDHLPRWWYLLNIGQTDGNLWKSDIHRDAVCAHLKDCHFNRLSHY